MSSITIVSAYFTEETRKLIELKYILTEIQNPGVEFDFIAVDNSMGNVKSFFSENYKRIRIVKGINSKEDIENCSRENYLGSYYHAYGLNRILRNGEIKTKFVLFIDTDFFIIAPNWIGDVYSYMKKKSLLFFGTPNDPTRFLKFRYFPSVQCFFVDMEHHLFDIEKLDFTPDANKFVLRRSIYDFIANLSSKGNMFYAIPVRERLKRIIIETSRDTACRIYDRYFRLRSIFELAKPVFKPRSSLLDNILPDFLSYVPKNYLEYYTEKSFVESGFSYNIGKDVSEYIWHDGPISFNNCYERGYEEYFWQEKPFAVHMRIRKDYVKTKR